MNKFVLIIGSLILVAGCTGRAVPTVANSNPDNVLVDYTRSSLMEATTVAQQFCASHRKNAQYVKTERKTAGRIRDYAMFNCVATGTEILVVPAAPAEAATIIHRR